MSARRFISITTLALLLAGIAAVPAMAQFTPRFSTKQKGYPSQWHIGIGGTALNLGDHTNAYWQELDADVPTIHIRLGVAVPIKEESLYILPELEGRLASTRGRYIEPVTQISSDVSSISQIGYALLLNMVKITANRRTIFGGGVGYYMLKHNPEVPASMMEYTPPLEFHQDPFMHIGLGAQFHVAKTVAQLKENTNLMLEGRYKFSYMDGDVSGRRLLMSEFLLTVYLAIK